MGVRFLRNKKLRAALWRQSKGKCAICEQKLEKLWHADHKVPYKDTHKTNVHEMQALCISCNLRKGTMKLRSHQSEIVEICKRVASGTTRERRIIAHVTPGGGKSMIPQIAAKYLIPAIANKICWVVPRLSLQRQGAQSFIQDSKLLSHNLEIRESTNEVDPSRGTIGYITTYNAIRVSPDLHADEFIRNKYILVLDEVHHAYENSADHKALQRMVDNAAFVIYLSGTMGRHDGAQIAFMPYKNEKGHKVIDLTPTENTAIVEYGLRKALQEKSVLPLTFIKLDGSAEWFNGTQKESVSSLAHASGNKATAALFTILNTKFALQLLDKAVASWREYARVYKGKARLLIIAKEQSEARKYLDYLRGLGVRSDIAISDDGEQAQEAISGFRAGKFDALVTVAMAYEGMDVPGITHLALLTHIRSMPWIHQALARITRIDKEGGDYNEQVVRAFVPDDEMMNEVISYIENEQRLAVSDDNLDRLETLTTPGERQEYDRVVPLASQVTTERESELGGLQLTPEETYAYRKFGELQGLGDRSAVEIKRLVEAAQQLVIAQTFAEDVPQTPKQREKQLRTNIADISAKIDSRHFQGNFGTFNKIVWKIYRKAREDMTESELQEVHERALKFLASGSF